MVTLTGKFTLDEAYTYLLTGDLDAGSFTIEGVGDQTALGTSGTLPDGMYSFSASLSGFTGEAFAYSNELTFNLALSPFSAVSPVPEPTSLVLLGGALGATSLYYRRRRSRAAGA